MKGSDTCHMFTVTNFLIGVNSICFYLNTLRFGEASQSIMGILIKISG